MTNHLPTRPMNRVRFRSIGLAACLGALAPTAFGQTAPVDAAAAPKAAVAPAATPATPAATQPTPVAPGNPVAPVETTPPANAQEPAPTAPTETAPATAVAPPTTAITAEAATEPAETDGAPSADVTESDDEAPKLNLYGFTDFTFTKDWGSDPLNANPYSSFAVGNFNLYIGSELGHNWRTLSEVRFMYLPNGEIPYNAYYDPSAKRADTTVQDYADGGHPVRWGGIAIQRAYIEHTFHELVTVRAGQFLTPYGIWNVDHGSPVIIGVRRPYVIGDNLFPSSQSGFEIFGSAYVRATQFGYHLTLSNGRGPIDTFKDLDSNKAIGGRLFVRTEGDFGTLAVGFSAYRGKYTDRSRVLVMHPNGSMSLLDPALSQYMELSLGTDIKWEFENLLVQTEAILNDIAYTDGRAVDPGFGGGPRGFVPDNRKVGVYGLVGYRTPWWNIMPFVGADYLHYGRYAFVNDAGSLWGGLNIRPIPRVVLKAQLTRIIFPSDPAFGVRLPNSTKLDAQIAWSF